MSRNNIIPNVSGEKIAALRKAVEPCMSQDALAKRMQLEGVDVDKGTVQRIEAGKRSVSREEINAIAKILKTTPEAFSTDEVSDE